MAPAVESLFVGKGCLSAAPWRNAGLDPLAG